MIELEKDHLISRAEEFAKRAKQLLPNHPSLFAGLSGLSLFNAEIFKTTRIAKYRKASIDLIEKSISLLNDKYTEFTLANGVAGVGWTIKYLLKNEIIYGDEVLDDFDRILLESLKEADFPENQTYDLLYGLIGKGVYFLEDERRVNSEALTLIFQRLMKISKYSSCGVVWYDMLGRKELNEEENYFNYGLAHGLPSLVAFFCALFEKDIFRQECKDIINSLIHQMKSAKLERLESLFPSDSRTSSPSRLSWCYGDIGVAIAFQRVSRILNDRNLEIESNNLFSHSAQRKIKDAFVRTDSTTVENGFCHGSFGVSYLFNQAFIKTNIPDLKAASAYWLSVNSSQSNDLNSKIKSQKYDFDNRTWQEDGSLLNGYCGMGLVLLSLNSDNSPLRNITLTNM